MAAEETARVLVVEDHPATGRALRMYLNGQGYAVEVANSVAAAKQMAESFAFDVLICDLNLPDGTGWEFLEYLRGIMPVAAIAYSAYGQPEHRRRSDAAGFAEHIVKGSAPEALVEAIERLLKSAPASRITAAV
jgi:CheY-like chemotaxis protein